MAALVTPPQDNDIDLYEQLHAEVNVVEDKVVSKRKCESTIEDEELATKNENGLAVETDDEFVPYQEVDVKVNDEDRQDNGGERQLRLVQRVKEGIRDMSIETGGKLFDFVVVLNLPHNAMKSLEPLVGMAGTLRVLNASHNALATLPPVAFWARFRALRLCFLSQNQFQTWPQVQGLEGCSRSLLWLALADNPLMDMKNARSIVVNKLPFLQALDNFVIADHEILPYSRSSARFQVLSPRLHLAQFLMPLTFETEDAAILYANHVITSLRRMFVENSPSVCIQRVFRGYRSRRGTLSRFRQERELSSQEIQSQRGENVPVNEELRGQHDMMWIGYMPEFETELLTLASLAAQRDPYLTTFSHQAQQEFLHRRCVPSGISVLRAPALLRAFPSDHIQANELLITEKSIVQDDLKLVTSQIRQMMSTSQSIQDESPALLLHFSQVARELRQRLVTCNRKILKACLQQQTRRRQGSSNKMYTSLSNANVRVRGHAPCRWERERFYTLASVPFPRYPKMKVFIPWTMEMYRHMVTNLQSTTAIDALPYENAKRLSAAVRIQSTWRAYLCRSQRNTLAITTARACVCIQRWWRYCRGLRRRLDLLRVCLVVGASINSRTVFMETKLYHMLVKSWTAVETVIAQRQCHEHALQYRIGPDGHVELILTPAQRLVHAASQDKRSGLHFEAPNHLGILAERMLWSSERCNAFLPLLMPGTPIPELKSTESRSEEEDTAASLLVDGVQIKSSITEDDLIPQPQPLETLSIMNPLCAFPICQRVVDSGRRIQELAWRLSTTTKWRLELSQRGSSFVRLTFDSIDEARKRAMLLVCKTFDPVTKTSARMISLEGIYGAALHQYQVTSHAVTKEEIQAILNDARDWVQDDNLASTWRLTTVRKLEDIARTSTSKDTEPQNGVRRAERAFHVVQESIPRQEIKPRVFPRPRQGVKKPVSLHLIESTENAIVPSMPECPRQPRPSFGSNRHQMLMNRLGHSSDEVGETKENHELQTRKLHVQELREARERALEAQLVDERMLQRDKAIQVAYTKLDIDAKLLRRRFEKDLNMITTRESREKHRQTSRFRKLTHHFETSFVAQSGALMRRAARATVAKSLMMEEQEQERVAAAVRVRQAQAVARRQEVTSFWFVQNRQKKITKPFNQIVL